MELLISLVIIAIFAQPGGCASQTSAGELRAIIIDSSEDQNTFRFTTDLKEELLIGNFTTGANHTEKILVNSFTEGEANYTSRMMRESTLTAMQYGSDNASQPVETEIYIANDTAYIRFEENWTKMTFSSPETLWRSQNTINQQLEVLNQSSIELAGSEVLDGQDCYLIKVTPNMSAYAAIISQPMGSLTPLLPVNLTNVYRNSTAVWINWITKEGHVLKKSYLEMTFAMAPDALGLEEDEDSYNVDAKANATMIYSDYNQPVEIVLPIEAYNATEIELPSENISLTKNLSQDDNQSRYENLLQYDNASQTEASVVKPMPEAVPMSDMPEAVASQPQRFPLRGGNEHGNATVFGSTEKIDYSAKEKLILVDMAMSEAKLPVEVFLVDYGNNYYRGDLVWKGDAFPLHYGYRQLYGFQLPERTDIKEICITPQGGEPFYIDWVPVAQASSENLTIKFLRLDDSGYSSGWRVEVEIENSGSDKAELEKADFALEDQFGWEYTPDSIGPAGYYGQGSQIDMGPGEKADATLEVKDVSPISRPVAIIYRPDGLRIDISSWT